MELSIRKVVKSDEEGIDIYRFQFKFMDGDDLRLSD